MKFGKNAIAVLEKRYLKKDENGQPCERVEDMFERVADTIAAADLIYDKKADTAELSRRFYKTMTDLEFLPNSPTLMNAGRDLGQLSACFVLPIADSMEDIFEAVKQAALIHKSGGGTGFSFSRLRSSGSTVRSTGGVASGPISFMRVFNMATEAVKQGGTRRGANMGILRVDHPDILQFIDAKKDNVDITNFNLSVGITEKFMQAVQLGSDYNLVDPHSGDVVGSLNAAAVFDKIVQGAWRNGEPGIIFLDRLNRDNVVPSQGEIESTNPCGEQPLLPHESCNLGSINLGRMLTADAGSVEVDWDKLRCTVKLAVHFLDNVIDVNKYPLEEIAHTTRLTRKIGLGVMGFADMLLRMGVPYNSPEAVDLAEKVMEFVSQEGRAASQKLAEIRGAFPLFDQSTYKDGPPLRNATVTTIAPTGTLSIIAGCSSGVEPVFAYAYIRNVMDNTQLVELSPILQETLDGMDLSQDNALMQEIAQAGSLAHIEKLPEDMRRVFVCSHDISPTYHVKIQAAFQRFTDNAVSKTVNFPNEATPEEVRQVFMLAYNQDCKGVTIYRDGSRDNQVLNIGKVNDGKESAPSTEYGKILPRPRPAVTYGITQRTRIGCGNLYITVNYDENGICEVFTSTGKAGGCPSQSEATARLASIALRSGINIDEILHQLRGIRCPSTIRQKGMECTSCPDAIARAIKKVETHLEEQKKAKAAPMISEQSTTATQPVQNPTDHEDTRFCPECHELLEHEGGCVSCRSCGYSKCN